MGPYGFLWAFMRSYKSLWGLMGPLGLYASLWISMCPYVSYKSLCVFMGNYGFC